VFSVPSDASDNTGEEIPSAAEYIRDMEKELMVGLEDILKVILLRKNLVF
jgi:hypothetical protein